MDTHVVIGSPESLIVLNSGTVHVRQFGAKGHNVDTDSNQCTQQACQVTVGTAFKLKARSSFTAVLRLFQYITSIYNIFFSSTTTIIIIFTIYNNNNIYYVYITYQSPVRIFTASNSKRSSCYKLKTTKI